MNSAIGQTSDLLNIVIQIVVIVVPVILSWFVRTYVTTHEKQKRLGIIVQLANAAIDYAEDLDKRGELGVVAQRVNLSGDTSLRLSRGLQKLNIASDWLAKELQKNNIDVTEEDAKKWIAAEFQNRVGSVGVSKPAAEITTEVAQLIDELETRGLIVLPTNLSQAVELTSLLAGWIVNYLNDPDADKRVFQREEATNILRAKLIAKPQSPPVVTEQAPDNMLGEIARAAVAYTAQIRNIRPLPAPERDIAIARVQMETAQLGMNVSMDEISAAVDAALAARTPTATV